MNPFPHTNKPLEEVFELNATLNAILKKEAFVKTSLLFMAVMMILLSFSAIPAFAQAPSIIIGGEPLQIPADEPGPYINAQHRIMIPVSFVSRELGADVGWNFEDRRVTISGNGKEIQLTIGMSEATVNGEIVSFDTKAEITRSRTFVPLRFVSEAMGLHVSWDTERRIAAIDTEDSDEAEAVIQSMTEPSVGSEVVDELEQMAREVVRLTNLERSKRGLDPVDIDVALMKVAEFKSVDMRQNQTMSHDSPKYGGLRGLLAYYAVEWGMAAENIARGQRSAEHVVDSWMNSPGHRDNILRDKVTKIGVGVVESDQGHYWTQLLIS